MFDEISGTAAGAHEYQPETQSLVFILERANVVPSTAEAVELIVGRVGLGDNHFDAFVKGYQHWRHWHFGLTRVQMTRHGN